MATIFDYALLAGRAYYDTRADVNRFPIPQGWTDLLRHEANPSGFEAATFTNGTEIVISYAGTGPGLNVDWVADCALALGAWSDQLGEAAAYYLQVKAANTINGITPNITFTGHSLGGGLAALMSVFFGGTSMTFDQAPFAASATIAMRDQLVADRFDQALAANPGLTSWALTQALMDFHLTGSDTEALGGDLAYQYGKNGNLSNVGLAAAQAILSDPAFGTGAQALRPLTGLQEGALRLG